MTAAFSSSAREEAKEGLKQARLLLEQSRKQKQELVAQVRQNEQLKISFFNDPKGSGEGSK